MVKNNFLKLLNLWFIKLTIWKHKPIDLSGPSGFYKTFDELKKSKLNNYAKKDNTNVRKINIIKELDELRDVLQKSKRKLNKDEMI